MIRDLLRSQSPSSLGYRFLGGLGQKGIAIRFPTSPSFLFVMGRSLAGESARPILAPSNSSKRGSQRASVYSNTPSLARSEATVNTTSSNDPVIAEFKYYTEGLDRMENKRLQQQRYVPSREKTESLSQLALQAKLERALDRRMTSQDAVLRPKVMLEKPRVDFSRTASSPA